ncbi:hypothetical protein [uncultured Gimesia sp.]|uniref:hypothetical protein n=1 Tax=uncultured Gimesia sp. TaxID=1678688 RepID=UPI00261B1D0B|nr:hypothetical protein [uncultured Gimesia sp.]
MDKHSDAVITALANLKAVEADILNTGLELMQSADGYMYVFDQFVIATLNRAVAISSAFHSLVEARNMVSAGALLRVHLDTALRHFASHLVEDWDAFAEAEIRGDKINRMVDRDGTKLTDFHLSKEFEKQVPGTRNLYERACGYVHFSEVHTTSVLNGVDRENHIVGIKISAVDRELPDSYYIDACNTFAFISQTLIDLIQSWIDYKVKNDTTRVENAL